MRIQLDQESAQLIQKMKQEFKERQLTIKDWDLLISKALLSLKYQQWQALINEQTPPDFFIKSALQDEKTKQEILKFLAKKSIKSRKDIKSYLPTPN